MRIRLRGPAGASTVTLADNATVGDLIRQISEKTSISSFDVKYGYPPKPLLLELNGPAEVLSSLGIRLNGEQLTINPRDDDHTHEQIHERLVDKVKDNAGSNAQRHSSQSSSIDSASVVPPSQPSPDSLAKPVSLERKKMQDEAPELPLPERGSTMILRVMPDDNSCLFRAFGTAVLPGDDQSMPELRSLVASAIQAEPETYSKVVLEQDPDQYCQWIQTPDAWGGAIEMGILSKHFDIEISSIDVQSLRVDRFNEGAHTRCILVYSGIHYDTIVQSPSDYPHTKAVNPPDFDTRVWNSDDDEILLKALELCKKLQAQHYFTDTGGMAIKCNICGSIVYGEGQAAGHAQQTGHYDMAEVTT